MYAMRLSWAGQSLRAAGKSTGNRILQEPGHGLNPDPHEWRYRGIKLDRQGAHFGIESRQTGAQAPA
jgi:hypothetical protein